MDLALYTHNCERLDNRPALVFLPAFPLDHRMWLPVTQRLEGVPCVLVDGPGFGQSSTPYDPPSLDIYGDYLASVLAREGVNRAIVVGSSMGGYVALSMLQRRKELLAGIALIGTRADADNAAARAARLEMAIGALVGRADELLLPMLPKLLGATSLQRRLDLVQEVENWLKEACPEAVAWSQRAMANRHSQLDTLQRCELPSLVLRGEEDTISTADMNEAMAEALCTRVVSVPEAGHLVAVEDPGAVARAVRDLYPLC